jgi:putative restriction endonuclease
MFGEIDTNLFGNIYNNRKELSESGIHRPYQAGIWGSQYKGAYSIVVSGGYKDDYDRLFEISYTGQGGRDANGKIIKDQELTRGNKGLAINCEKDIPVRVVRGYQVFYGPKHGYRYDGLYRVENYDFVEGFEGYKVYKFLLRSLLSKEELKKISESKL